MTNRKKIIILFTVIFIILLAFSITFYYYKFNRPSIETTNKQTVQTFNTEAYTIEYKLTQKAIQENNSDYCKELSSDKQNNCFYAIASTLNEIKFCEQIKASDLKSQCQELVLSRQFISQKNASQCLTLTNYQMKQQCLTEIFRQYSNLKQCANSEVTYQELCENLVYLKLAFEKTDLKICEKIKDKTIKDDCLITVTNKPLDSDNDGILDYLERSYGTNPFKADTDGDGYNDFEELKSGFNPLEEGKF